MSNIIKNGVTQYRLESINEAGTAFYSSTEQKIARLNKMRENILNRKQIKDREFLILAIDTQLQSLKI